MQKQNGYILPTPDAVEYYKPFCMRARMVHIITYLLYSHEVSAVTLSTSEIVKNYNSSRNFKQTCCLQATLAYCKSEKTKFNMDIINIKPCIRKAMHKVAMKQHNGAAMSKPNGLDPKNL